MQTHCQSCGLSLHLDGTCPHCRLVTNLANRSQFGIGQAFACLFWLAVLGFAIYYFVS